MERRDQLVAAGTGGEGYPPETFIRPFGRAPRGA
jgi:hypothetical protein